MNDETSLERELLRKARRGLSPSRADEERVRAALTRLVALAPPAPSGPNDDGAPENAAGTQAHAGSVAAPEHAAGAAGRWFSRLAISTALVAAGGTGYLAGHRAGFERGSAVSRVDSRPAPASPSGVPSDDRLRSPAPVVPPVPAEPASPRALLKKSSGAADAPDLGLDEEVRLLKRIERALRDQNPRYALGLLGELERAVPGGQLVEERHAAKAMARCQLAGGSDAVASEFAKTHPGSAYASRVTETCRGGAQ
jgi:hypothetical protein